MRPTKDHRAISDEAVPRRKYEIDEQDGSRVLFKSVIGLVLVNAVVLVKNLLFGKADPQHHPADQVQAAAGTATIVAGVNDETGTGIDLAAVIAASLEDPQGDLQANAQTALKPTIMKPLQLASGVFQQIAQPAGGGVVAQVRFTSGGAGNDNEKLYGAVPGSAISTFVTEGGRPNRAFGVVDGGGADAGGARRASGDEQGNPTTNPRNTNRLPVIAAPVVLTPLLQGTIVAIAAADLLRNAVDPDGSALSVLNLSVSSGQININPEGGWLFQAEPGDTSIVSFTYTITDGIGGTVQTAYLDLVSPQGEPEQGTSQSETIVASSSGSVIDAQSQDDIIIGRASADIIFGGDGNDRIVAGAGNDVVYGGAGDDTIYAGAGNDQVFGGTGNDEIRGEDGNDQLAGEDGNDVISGGVGNDIVVGGSGDDRLAGESGDDRLAGGAGQDQIIGGSGDDLILGDDGNDDIAGDQGNDRIDGGAGDDNVRGGAGNDVVLVAVGDGNDSYDGGDGIDTYNAVGTANGVVINLLVGTAAGSEIGVDQITSFENVSCGSGDDTIVAGIGVNMISGGEGDDIFVFGSVAATGSGQGSRDRILDFAVGDRIDIQGLSQEFAEALDATFQDESMRRFVLVRDQVAFSTPGEMRYRYDSFEGRLVTILEGNIDFDEDAEFQIELIGQYELQPEDFYARY